MQDLKFSGKFLLQSLSCKNSFFVGIREGFDLEAAGPKATRCGGRPGPATPPNTIPGGSLAS
ncbi:hypothetical protein Hanom_Chr03g00179041 [Helianthus anomalus]